MAKRTTGSFGIPEDMARAIQESKDKGAKEKRQSKEPSSENSSTFYDSESIPEDAEDSIKEDKEALKLKTIEDTIKETEKNLGVKITEDDVWAVIMGNQLKKEGIEVFPGKLQVTFRTLTVDESKQIDKEIGTTVSEKWLDSAFDTLKTQHLLSFGIVELGKPGKGRSLGKTPKESFDQIGKMSTLLVERLAQKWNQFNWLTNVVVNKEMDSGKS